MDVQIRDIAVTDLAGILVLNESEVPHVGSVSMHELRWFATHADYFRVACSGTRIAGFLIGLRPGSTYGSPNYRWFADRYADFAYIDRVAVTPEFRRYKLASRLYADFAQAMSGVPRLACEVNIRPPNEASMRFHRSLGFVQVGSRVAETGDKEVAMLVLPGNDQPGSG